MSPILTVGTLRLIFSPILAYHALFTLCLCREDHLDGDRILLPYARASSKENGEQHNSDIIKPHPSSPETDSQRQQT